MLKKKRLRRNSMLFATLLILTLASCSSNIELAIEPDFSSKPSSIAEEAFHTPDESGSGENSFVDDDPEIIDGAGDMPAESMVDVEPVDIMPVSAQSSSSAASTNGNTAAPKSSVFTGYSLTVLDTTTPATNIWGRTNDPNTMCFRSADGKELGSLSYANYQAIIMANKVVVQLEGGASQYDPPGSYNDWELWFVDHFNAYRGLSLQSRQEAAATYSNNVVEEYRQEIIRLTNAEREKVGVPPLAVNDDAMALAQIRAEEIRDNFSHTRPNGERKEVNGNLVVENIHMGSITPEGAIAAWMNSEGHRSNMLNPDAYEIGVGAFRTSNDTWYWTQEFIW